MDGLVINMFKRFSIWIVVILFFVKAEKTIAQGFRQRDMRSNFNNSAIDNTAGMRRIDVIKDKYLSENMNLSADESDRFWPLYKQYQTELTTVLHQKRQNMLNSKKSPQDIVDDNLDFDSKILSIKKHYKDEFAKVLPPDKLMHFYQSERGFNEEMINRLRRGHENNE